MTDDGHRTNLNVDEKIRTADRTVDEPLFDAGLKSEVTTANELQRLRASCITRMHRQTTIDAEIRSPSYVDYRKSV